MNSRSIARATIVLTAAGFAACHGAGSPAGAPSPAASAGAPMKAVASNVPAAVTPAAIAMGDSIFNTASCQRCHGKGGVGATNGPSLTSGKWQHGSGSYDDILRTITTGVPKDSIKDPSHPFAMRARGGVNPLLTDDQVAAVAAYVYKISHP